MQVVESWSKLGPLTRGAIVLAVLLTVFGALAGAASGEPALVALALLAGGCLLMLLVEHSWARDRARQQRHETLRIRESMRKIEQDGTVTQRTACSLLRSWNDTVAAAGHQAPAGAIRDLAQTSMDVESVKAALIDVVESTFKQNRAWRSAHDTDMAAIYDRMNDLSGRLDDLVERFDLLVQTTQELGDGGGSDSRAVKMLESTSPVSLQRRIALDTMAISRLYSEDSALRNLPLCAGWALDPVSLSGVIQEVMAMQGGGTILEIGSGVSTAWIANELSTRKSALTFVSIEHDPRFLASTRAVLERAGLSEFVDLRLAPLEPCELRGNDFLWYSNLEDLQDISVMLVDGPPGNTGAMARFPAVPMLASRLRDGAVVMLDDTDRADERRIISAWSEDPFAGVKLAPVRAYGRLTVLEAHVEQERVEDGRR